MAYYRLDAPFYARFASLNARDIEALVEVARDPGRDTAALDAARSALDPSSEERVARAEMLGTVAFLIGTGDIDPAHAVVFEQDGHEQLLAAATAISTASLVADSSTALALGVLVDAAAARAMGHAIEPGALVVIDPMAGYPRCFCCGCLLDTRGGCPVCDSKGLVSPPHVCIRSGETLTDEHGCEPHFDALPPDHETDLRQRPAA